MLADVLLPADEPVLTGALEFELELGGVLSVEGPTGLTGWTSSSGAFGSAFFAVEDPVDSGLSSGSSADFVVVVVVFGVDLTRRGRLDCA